MSEFESRIGKLRRRFQLGASEDAIDLESALDQIGEGSLRASRDILDRVHKIAGIAGMLGFAEIHELATSIESEWDEKKDIEGDVRNLICVLLEINNDKSSDPHDII